MARLVALVVLVSCVAAVPRAAAGDAPQWMHALVSVPLPEHDEKTNAVQLYSESVVTVISQDRIHRLVREAYKILRPDGRGYGVVEVPFWPQQRVTHIRGWCIPAQGKDYEIKEKDAAETAVDVEDSELIGDLKQKVLRIPAADPGNIVGYEYEMDEQQPHALQDVWFFQGSAPVREARYTLQLPPGWEYKATWLNAVEVKPSQSGSQWSWSVGNVRGLRHEAEAPPFRGVAGHMIVNFYPPGGVGSLGFADWRQMGTWYTRLAGAQVVASPQIKAKVMSVTVGAGTPWQKIQAIAAYVQKDIRYVAIELGIGGYKPHDAPEIFDHHYGDCKDKATLTRTMLQEIGVDSYYVLINARRGSVSPQVAPYLGAFNHVVVAIKLPAGTDTTGLYSTMQHPTLGTLLFFDPTSELTPIGQIGGYLQGNYGLLVAPDGGELVELPKEPVSATGIRRTGKITIDANGTLTGEFKEVRLGDEAREQRSFLRQTTKDTEHIQPLESMLSHAFGTFQIRKASIVNRENIGQQFAYEYTVVAPNYAKPAGNLLLVRPRVLGSESSGLLETKEPRRFPVVFDAPAEDTDTFEITLPPGYEVEELPPPVNVDYGFASYHSRSEANGNVLRYTRALDIKQLTVPVERMNDLKMFYRIIATDERATAVLRPATK